MFVIYAQSFSNETENMEHTKKSVRVINGLNIQTFLIDCFMWKTIFNAGFVERFCKRFKGHQSPVRALCAPRQNFVVVRYVRHAK